MTQQNLFGPFRLLPLLRFMRFIDFSTSLQPISENNIFPYIQSPIFTHIFTDFSHFLPSLLQTLTKPNSIPNVFIHRFQKLNISIIFDPTTSIYFLLITVFIDFRILISNFLLFLGNPN